MPGLPLKPAAPVRPSFLNLGLAGAAFLVIAAFLGWAYAQPGTLGLYRWGHRVETLGLAALAALPLVLASISWFAARNKARGAETLGTVAAVFAGIALLAGTGLAAYVLSRAYGPIPETPARPRIVDPASPQPAFRRIAISSDPHFDADSSAGDARRSILARAASEYRAGSLDALVVLGDFTAMGMEPSGWNAVLGEIGRYAPDLPLLALMGNHDSLIGGARRWRAALGPWGEKPAEPLPGGALSSSSWYLRSGTLHLVSLDLLWGPEGFGKRERAWLAERLAAIPEDEYTVVLTHSFFYSSGYVEKADGSRWYDHEAMLREVAPLLAGKADLVVSGHNHYMEWLEADGTAWAVVGAMGGVPDPEPGYVSPASVWFRRGSFGWLALEPAVDGLRCSFEDQNGAVLFTRTIN